MSVAVRLGIAAVVLVVFKVGTWVFVDYGMPSEVRQPNHPLSDLPLELGDWKGEDRPSDPRLDQAVGADQIVNRIYRDSQGHAIALHCAAWGYKAIRQPHLPDICYTVAGYSLVRNVPVTVPVANADVFPARFLTVDRDGQTVYVLYWYALGRHLVNSRSEMGPAQRFYRGAEALPPVVKVMLSSSDPDREQALARLRELGGQVYEHMRDL